MNSLNLIRWGGLLLVVSGLLLAFGMVFHPPVTPAGLSTNMWVVAHVAIFVGMLFSILGLICLYGRQVKETGILGFIGFIMAFIAISSFMGVVYFEAFLSPVLAADMPGFAEEHGSGIKLGALTFILPLTGLTFILGHAVFGVAIIRAGILPKWAAGLAIIGSVPVGLTPVVPLLVAKTGAVVFGLGYVWLGYALWSEKRA
jgi:hypothetical protein